MALLKVVRRGECSGGVRVGAGEQRMVEAKEEAAGKGCEQDS